MKQGNCLFANIPREPYLASASGQPGVRVESQYFQSSLWSLTFGVNQGSNEVLQVLV